MKIAAEAQHNHVKPADIMPDNIDLINSKKSPVREKYIEKYLA